MPFNGAGSNLSGASDVFLSSTANNDLLKYNGSTSKWNNALIAKGDIGLANVDNTSDLNKPVSTDQAAAITDAIRLTDALAMHSGSAYPTRASVTSDTTRRVRWVGPTAPAIGGDYAINGLDVWEDTV